ncbi:MAG: preprotein translocase subunit SecA [Gammaproteobacteria bacterium]|nr:preprotein translocase subunit SecA [Gammaproteobacteria bacterium]NNL06106.1 preprotein translocase subunit SecA [Gammaproteobacteria bacterium]
MISNLASKIFGSRNERIIKKHHKAVDGINRLEPEFESLSDEQLAAKTLEFRQRYNDGETLDQLLPEAFAAVREAGKRVLHMRHFDVQLIGGMVLHSGKIAEMRTGEGKTLVATLAAYLNAIPGKGVHVITVNDYLASRDAEWMGRLYNFLGLTTGVSLGGMDHAAKKQAYAADITYGTNNEFGFDYLRDNMAFTSDDKVQRELNFAIVDEVDSILIDEARTPLIISGAVDDSSELHLRFKDIVKRLERGEMKAKDEPEEGDFSVDEKHRAVHITEQGHQRVEQILIDENILPANESLYSAKNINLLHYLNAALRADALYELDVHYIVKDKQVVIVDEFTGRTMPGRRWSEGLHQAVEAKEGVPIQNENQTLASITFQNYFRLYEKLSGMTGTADTEAPELMQIYSLEVIIIPTNMVMIRDDMTDQVFLTKEEKNEAIMGDVKDCVARNQPVLVGTASIEVSEQISALLEKTGIKHNTLNAKQHENEAHVIAQAGRPGNVTIATNMAGRGTDIVLGGNLEAELDSEPDASDDEKHKITEAWHKRHQTVIEAGGLHVIGSERHESRRVDNQLRGRSGRQGDPGSSRFYLSMQDDLMRIFASDKVGGLMKKLGMQHGEAIEHPWVTRAIENAQRKVEGHNFDIRKQLLEYDDVANDQRKVIYSQRNEMMATDDLSDVVSNIREDVVNDIVSEYIPHGSLDEQWDLEGLQEALHNEFGVDMPVVHWMEEDADLNENGLRDKILQILVEDYEAKEQVVGADGMRQYEKYILLQVLDKLWKEHLAAMDYLRQSIGLRGYAQKNPKQEYKRESFNMFTEMLDRIKHEAVTLLSKVQIRAREEVEDLEHQGHQQPENVSYQHQQAGAMQETAQAEDAAAASEQHKPYVRGERKLGRNEPCWCGSGKKFKHCHGKLV